MKKAGEPVSADETLVELETDKVTLEDNAARSGVLSDVLFPVGARVKVGAVLARVTQSTPSTNTEMPPKESAEEAEAPTEAPTEAPKGAAQKSSEKISDGSSKQSNDISSEITIGKTAGKTSPPKSVPTAGPAARKALAEAGLTAAQVPASGVGGRVTKTDVATAVSLGARRTPEGGVRTVREERVPMDPLRRRVIEQILATRQTMAAHAVFAEVDLGKVLDLCETYGDSFERRHGVSLGLMGFFAKALVLALQEFPALNACIDGEDIVYRRYYDFAVSMATESGMVMPVVRDVENLSMASFEKTLEDCAVRAAFGQLSLDELTGGTFTLANSAGLGAMLSTPALSAGQSGVLALHEAQDRPTVVDGEVAIRPMMFLALGYDLRLVDERTAVLCLARIKALIEDPQRLVIDV